MMTMEELTARVDAALPQGVGSLLAALSGGADSVALVLALCALREKRGLTVRAAHVNHGLRGAESDGDEAFVEALCARLGVPLDTVRLTPPEEPSETWAREARYAALFTLGEKRGAEALVTAHHRDDQAETVLMRLMRGCGPAGACAMAPDSGEGNRRILRPLLDVPRAELRQALTGAGETWREDSSNARPDCLRNALRLTLLPQMEALSPGTAAHLASFAALQREEQALLRAMEDDFFGPGGAKTAFLPLARLAQLHPVLRGRVLRRWWQVCAGEPLDRAQTERLDGLLSQGTGTSLSLPGGLAEKGSRFLHRVRRAEPFCTAVPETGTAQAGEATLTVRPWRETDGPGDGRRAQMMGAAALRQCVLRTRQPGDWLRPFGGGGRKKLQDVLVDRRVDRPFRDRVPLLCRGSEVLLAGGVTAGNIPQTAADEARVMVLWSGALPWLDEPGDGGAANE